ncbi:MAG: hypothetical protein JXR29_07740, partial [Methylothermaceae bacterium]|nr:hypothetical protein [Methylothermaceae bacterium]
MQNLESHPKFRSSIGLSRRVLQAPPLQSELIHRAALTLRLGSWRVTVGRLPPGRDELVENY